MTWARIKNGVVIDCIVLDDESLVSFFSEGFDAMIRIDNIGIPPSVGWNYDGSVFTP